MSDFNLPTVNDSYTNYLAYLKNRDVDLALALDPATCSPTNVPANAVRWNSVAAYWEKFVASVWGPLATTYNINVASLGGSAAALYAKLASPTFTGTPAGPTATAGTNSTQLATTAFVTAAIAAASAFPTGTKMIFAQATAPTGWTQVTTVNDAAMRIVSGVTGGTTTGTAAFSATFANRTTANASPGTDAVSPGSTDGYTLTITDMPSHDHGGVTGAPSNNLFGNYVDGSNIQVQLAAVNSHSAVGSHDHAIPAQGGNGAHSHGHSATHSHTVNAHGHTLDMSVKYHDVIIASKN